MINDQQLMSRDGDVVNIAVRGDELDISSRHPANQDLQSKEDEEPRTLEILEEVEDEDEGKKANA